jgi:hypothetical protein
MSGVDIDFVRIAVTADQVTEYGLPTRPTKTSDSRTAKWSGASSVEVDAIDPNELRRLVADEIAACIDNDQLDMLLVAEHAERDLMRRLVAREVLS